MRGSTLLYLMAISALRSLGQFYPDSNACWLGVDDMGPPGFYLHLQLADGADTVINGNTYKKIDEFDDRNGPYEFVRQYLVRSSADGKGYLYLPDSAAEFLTGDASALAGDTVFDVIKYYPPPVDSYFISDAIVDSVVMITNNNISVIRHYLSGSWLWQEAYLNFWQAGMGTSAGPILRLHGIIWDAIVNDTVRYSVDVDDLGGYAICHQYMVGVNDDMRPQALIVSPNPSPSHFQLMGATIGKVQVFDVFGKEVLTTTGYSMDLSAEPPGHYYARVETPQGLRMVHLVVTR